jgi:NADPH2:quinone reductase
VRQVAIVKHGSPPEGLRLEDKPTPTPGPGEVLVQVEAIGVNFADTLARRGLYPDAPRIPYVPGYEAAGRILAAGSSVIELKAGDAVVVLLLKGGYADHVLAPASHVFRRPSGMDAETAAALPVQALTAWYALFETGTVRPGDRVLIHAAAGGVGSLAVQMALDAGAEVFGTAGSDEKVRRLREAGVTHAINYRTHDYETEVRLLTRGEGIDLVLDSLGGSHVARGMRLLRAGGRLASYGYAAQSGGRLRMILGFITMKTLRTAFLLRDSTGFHGINLVRLAGFPDRLRPRIDDIFELWEEGVLKPSIGGRFPLEEAWKAHEALESRSTLGKLLLLPGFSDSGVA